MILGIHGRKRVGKDTLASILRERYSFAPIAFADPIREMLGVLRVPEHFKQNKNEVIPQFGKTYTELCQTLGTDWGRDMVCKDIWLKIANSRRMIAESYGAPGVVFTDIRYPDEADFVQSIGGRIIFLEGNRGIVVNGHSSETKLDDKYADYRMRNDGTLTDLKEAADLLMQHLK